MITALQKTMDSIYGPNVKATYHTVDQINQINYKAKFASIALQSFSDQAAYIANANALHVREYQVSGENFTTYFGDRTLPITGQALQFIHDFVPPAGDPTPSMADAVILTDAPTNSSSSDSE